jgi:methylated-DNA-[protein]-cysteine S-methyltransferase
MTTVWTEVPSPIGTLLLSGDGHALTGVFMEKHRHEPEPAVRSGRRDDAAFRAAREQLEGYFAGELQVFDLPLALRGTEFQQRVWTALRQIPYGTTISYLELARRTGNPQAVRAVGAANGRNPISIIVPCHRVIGADGSLTGFGGGLERKDWLLRHEASHVSNASRELLLGL